MKRKIFVSINLPPNARKRLILTIQKWQDLPVKWVKEANLHITLFFLGYVADEIISQMCQKIEESCGKETIFDLKFDKIELAPLKDRPQMIWLAGEPSEELRTLHEKIEKELGQYSASRKIFRPHITLGRLRKRKWEALETKPEISEKYSLTLPVDSIDVMASDFGEGENEYTLIKKCLFK